MKFYPFLTYSKIYNFLYYGLVCCFQFENRICKKGLETTKECLSKYEIESLVLRNHTTPKEPVVLIAKLFCEVTQGMSTKHELITGNQITFS